MSNTDDSAWATPNLANLKIAMYLRLLVGGGAERVMLNLAKGLLQKGIQVDLVLNTKAGAYLDEVPESIRIIDLKAPRLLQGLPKLANYLRQEQPLILLSALHYTNEVAIWATRLSGAKTKVIVAEHNTLSAHAKHCKAERFSPLLARWFYPWADGVICVSQSAAMDLAQVTHMTPEQIKVIYNPVITPEMLAQAAISPQHPWLEPGEPPVILGVGRLGLQKDFQTLITAFSQVVKSRSARLMILGSGSERGSLERLAQDLGVAEHVHFAGFVQNPYAYISRAAVLVLSSRWEGLPTVLVESLALRTPVVSTDCPSGPREILSQGKFGALVPVENPDAIASSILETLESPSLTTPIDDALAQHLQQFTLETVTEQYIQYFYEVLGVSRTQAGQSPKRRSA
ncbi:glycosyltransferase [Leptolyngbya sp. PCC 6406]|uniref:glycosyltransferase n=1 Tax=Leptolyngbya sp. PCC 6406 TaxID=1173264 RepID=UPI0002ABF71C|nr:glycosyltransferase [Leptolyngbya sp. PCC 6406]